jgi:hypothetical protein
MFFNITTNSSKESKSGFAIITSMLLDKFIEVKSYSGSPYFYWSKNEIEVEKQERVFCPF